MLLLFKRLLKNPGIIPVCRKCTAFATPVRTSNLADHLSVLSGLLPTQAQIALAQTSY